MPKFWAVVLVIITFGVPPYLALLGHLDLAGLAFILFILIVFAISRIEDFYQRTVYQLREELDGLQQQIDELKTHQNKVMANSESTKR